MNFNNVPDKVIEYINSHACPRCNKPLKECELVIEKYNSRNNFIECGEDENKHYYINIHHSDGKISISQSIIFTLDNKDYLLTKQNHYIKMSIRSKNGDFINYFNKDEWDSYIKLNYFNIDLTLPAKELLDKVMIYNVLQ